MSAADAPPNPDLWGDIFDLAATAVIVLGWVGVIGLGVSLALTFGPLMFGKTVTFSLKGSVVFLVLAVMYPILSIVVGRFLRRRVRTSMPARFGIAVFAVIDGGTALLHTVG